MKNVSIKLLIFNYLHALLAKFSLKFKQLLKKEGETENHKKVGDKL